MSDEYSLNEMREDITHLRRALVYCRQINLVCADEVIELMKEVEGIVEEWG